MNLRTRSRIWFLTIFFIILASFLVTQFLLFSNTAIIGTEVKFWNMGLLYLSLLWTGVFSLLFVEKVYALNISKNHFINLGITFWISFIFGLVLSFDNYSWIENQNIFLSIFLILILSVLIIYLYLLLMFKSYSIKNKSISKLGKYSFITNTLFLKLFFTNWVYYDDVLFTNLDDQDLNYPFDFIITNNFVYLLHVNDSGNKSISFAKDKDGDLNSDIDRKEKLFKEYLYKVGIENVEDILVNILIRKTEDDYPIILGKPKDNFIFSSIKEINKSLTEYEKRNMSNSKFSERQYLLDVVHEDSYNK